MVYREIRACLSVFFHVEMAAGQHECLRSRLLTRTMLQITANKLKLNSQKAFQSTNEQPMIVLTLI